MNDIIHRALTTAKIPSRLEPSGLSRSDGKRPHGMSIVPWRSGRLLVWDTTCPDTFVASYRSLATSEAGRVAALAEDRKAQKYAHLTPSYLFTPVAIESAGAIGPQSWAFLKELGRILRQETGGAKSASYLLEQLSVAVQRGNAAGCHLLDFITLNCFDFTVFLYCIVCYLCIVYCVVLYHVVLCCYAILFCLFLCTIAYAQENVYVYVHTV